MVMRQAVSILGDFHRAQDATQETFIEAMISLDRLNDRGAMGAWLRSIARHRCHRILRSRDLEFLPPAFADQLPSADETPAGSAERRELRSTIANALGQLPADLRDAATLFYLKECSQRESAVFLSVPISTVNNRLHSARHLLKERIHAMPTTNGSRSFPARIGRIVNVDGPIVDARFDPGDTPDIFDALAAADEQGHALERMKVAQRPGGGIVRCIASGSADTLKTGMSVMNSREVGLGLTPWVGVTPMADEAIQRAMAVIAPAPASASIAGILETGIKPIDLFCPLVAGGTMALLGIQGVGRIVLVEELIHRLAKSAAASLRIVYLVEPNEPDSVRGMLTTEKEYPGDVVGQVATWWMLSEQAVDPESAAAMKLFDALVYCTPILGIQGLFPAIDPLASQSRAAVSDEHARTARDVRELIRRSRELMTDPVLLELLACRAKKKAWARSREYPPMRLSELSPEDRLSVARARKLERFLTTPFFVAERFNHRPGKLVPLGETIRGCRAILAGTFDDTPEEKFAFIGTIEET